eukprot:1385996-Amorphochlora_amoeboformis.AAC.1
MTQKSNKVNLKSLVKAWPESDKTEFGFEHVERGQYGGCKYSSKDGLSLNRTVITHLVTSLGKNIMEGKSVINISLPVTIFEPRSFLQRMTDHWSYAPVPNHQKTLTPILGANPSPTHVSVVAAGVVGSRSSGKEIYEGVE